MISSITSKTIRNLVPVKVSFFYSHVFNKSATFIFCLLWLAYIPVAANAETHHRQSNTKEYGYDVVNVYPHDPEAFTQGLIYKDGYLYESTGLFGKSSLRKVELETGKVLQKKSIDRKYFSEGLATNNNQLIQLSWKAGQGFIYDMKDFTLKKTFHYPGDGWGLTFNDPHFILSDGSSYLRFLDKRNLEEVKRIQVLYNDQPVDRINELEMVKGKIFANLWQTDTILIISPQTGHVIGQVNLAGLLNKNTNDSRGNVLNGIAYDEEGDRLFVTGKLWPKLFEIKLIPR